MNIMLLTTSYAENFATTIYQSLIDHSRKYHFLSEYSLWSISNRLVFDDDMSRPRSSVQLPQRYAGGVHINTTELIIVLLYIVFYEAYSFSILVT